MFLLYVGIVVFLGFLLFRISFSKERFQVGPSTFTSLFAYDTNVFSKESVPESIEGRPVEEFSPRCNAIEETYINATNVNCADEIFLKILDKFAKDKALSRFDMVQNQTVFVTIQQLSICMAITATMKSRNPTDRRWPTIQKWFSETSDIYARYYSGEQLSIDTYCSPNVFFNNKFMPRKEAQDRGAPFKTFNRLNNIQLSKLIMLAMSAALNNDESAMNDVVNETIDHIERNKYEDDFKPTNERIVSNGNNGKGTYNFQCGFIASEANRRSLILHYNSYYMMFLWSLFLIFRSFSKSSKGSTDYMEDFYKYKHDIGLVVRNLTDPTSIRTAPKNTAGQIYINKYKDIYKQKINFDLKDMNTISTSDADAHKAYFQYFFGDMDMKISAKDCINGKIVIKKPETITGESQLPDEDAVHLTTSKEVVEAITALRN